MGLMCTPTAIERAQAETIAKVNIHYSSSTHNSTTSGTVGPEFSVELRWERRGAPVDSLHSKNTWSAQASTCRRMPRYVNEAPISLLTSLRASISLRARNFFLLDIFARPPQQTSTLALAPFIFDSPRAHSFPVAVALTPQPPPFPFLQRHRFSPWPRRDTFVRETPSHFRGSLQIRSNNLSNNGQADIRSSKRVQANLQRAYCVCHKRKKKYAIKQLEINIICLGWGASCPLSPSLANGDKKGYPCALCNRFSPDTSKK